MMPRVFEPHVDDVLAFCARDPVERVFLEDVARRGHGRFVATEGAAGLQAICHLGTNVVPSGAECGAFSDAAAKVGARMLIGEERAVSELFAEARRKLPRPRDDRPGQPVYAISTLPEPGGTGLRPATLGDLDVLVPACAASHHEELGVDPLRRDAEGFRWRTRSQIEEGRSWVWLADGVIRFKAEASAWTPSAVQLQQVWVDPAARRRGYATRALRDLIRLLLERTPVVTLFVRADNRPAIRLYETIEMRRVLSYRSILL
jgi:ribosomal protein S18 acetylase RimI-like enzyme